DGPMNGSPSTAPLPEKIYLEAVIKGATWSTELSPSPNGFFDALLSVDFPVGRQDWQAARYRLTAGSQSAEAGGVVLRPATQSGKAIVAFLPLEYTLSSRGFEELADPRSAPRLNEVLRTPHSHAALPPVFYVGCVAPVGGSS